MTKLDNPFNTYVKDLFANLGRIRVRKMFSGAGVYSGEDMFALIDKDKVYVKSDEALKERLKTEGGESYEWTNPNTGKTIKMSYVSLPVNALDDRDEATAWGRQALDIAIEARRAKVKSPRRMTF